MDSITASPFHQRVLSKKLEGHQFSILLEAHHLPTRLDSSLCQLLMLYLGCWLHHLLVLICTLTLTRCQWWLGMDKDIEDPYALYALAQLLTSLATMLPPANGVMSSLTTTICAVCFAFPILSMERLRKYGKPRINEGLPLTAHFSRDYIISDFSIRHSHARSHTLTNCSKSQVLGHLYGRLSIVLQSCESKRQGHPCKILAGGRHTGRRNGLLIC